MKNVLPLEAHAQNARLHDVHAQNARLLTYAYMRFARDLDSRFGRLLLTGRLSKWYSQVGTEATTVAAGLAVEPGDVLCTLHRDLGAILAVYLDPGRTFPGFGFAEPDVRRPEPKELLYRLCCQLLGRSDGFQRRWDRALACGPSRVAVVGLERRRHFRETALQRRDEGVNLRLSHGR